MLFKNKAVLIIHGFAGGTYDYECLSNYLQKNPKFDVFTFTLPGHAGVVNTNLKYNDWIKCAEEHVTDLIGFGYKEIYLIGHSMGGVIATYLAVKYKQVKNLILLAPSFEYLIFKDGNLSILESIKSAPELFKEYDSDLLLSRILKFPISVVREFMKMVKKYHNYYILLNTPVLIIHGDKDNIVPLNSSKNVYEKIPTKNKKLVILNDVTHDICRSKKKELVSILIEKFLVNNKNQNYNIEIV